MRKLVLPAFILGIYACRAGAQITWIEWLLWEPRVIRADRIEPVTLTAVTRGAPSSVQILLEGLLVPMNRVSSDLFTATLPADWVLTGYQAGDAHNFIGFIDVYEGSTRVLRGNLNVNVRDPGIPDAPVRSLGPDVQMSPHLVNFRDDTLHYVDRATVPPEVFRRFYQYRDDEFDFISVIGQVQPFQNGFYVSLRNNVQGLGIRTFDNVAAYGSAGRLLGFVGFPIDSFFDMAEGGALHEIGHQWCCYLTLPALAQGSPHWPIGDVAYGIMGFGRGQGLDFPYRLTPQPGGNYLAEVVAAAREYNDLELYVMGMIQPGQVSRHFAFRDQNRQPPIFGGLVPGPVDFFTVDDISARDGPRIPAAGVAPVSFRAATIVLSRGRLLDANEMAFFEHMAARGEATTELPVRMGRAERAIAKPFILATGGRGRLSTTICPECIPRVPTALVMVSGDRQSAEAGATLPLPLVVELRDQLDNRMPGVQVNFAATNATVSPGSATTDATGRASTVVTLSGNPGAVTVTVRAANLPLVTFSATAIAPRPRLLATGVVNAASFLAESVAPGEMVTLFGSALGPPVLTRLRLTAAGQVDTVLAETRILFDNIPAPLIYVQANQSSAVVPYAVAGKPSTEVVIEYRGTRSLPVTVPVSAAVPALFTFDSSGRGQGAILNQDGSVNSVSNPAARGSIVVLYATGEGQTEPPGVDGKVAVEPLPKPRLPVAVWIGGAAAEILYAGAAPGLVAGVLQINARVPGDIVAGAAAPVSLIVGTSSSPFGVTLAVRQ